MRHLPWILMTAGVALLLVVAACSSGSSDGGGRNTTQNPIPSLLINSWPPSNPMDPVVLLSVTQTGAFQYRPGAAPNQTRVVVRGYDSSRMPTGEKTILFDPTGWGDGEHQVSIKDAAAVFSGAKTTECEVFLNAQLESGMALILTAKAP